MLRLGTCAGFAKKKGLRSCAIDGFSGFLAQAVRCVRQNGQDGPQFRKIRINCEAGIDAFHGSGVGDHVGALDDVDACIRGRQTIQVSSMPAFAIKSCLGGDVGELENGIRDIRSEENHKVFETNVLIFDCIV